MKNVVLGMLVVGLTSPGFSQEAPEAFSTVELKNVTVSPANASYLYSSRDENTPRVVHELQEKVAKYDVTSNVRFDKKSKKSFEMIFKASNGDIIANYNRYGEILSARESFKNVVLPMEIRKKAFQGNDGWIMSGNKYVSLYQNNEITHRGYKIKLTKQNLKKDLVIDMLHNE